MNRDDMNPTDEELAQAMEAARAYLEPVPGARRSLAELRSRAVQFATLTPTQKAVYLERIWLGVMPERQGLPHAKFLEWVPDAALCIRALALLEDEAGTPRN